MKPTKPASLSLYNPVNAFLTTSGYNGTILDDDPAPVLTVSDLIVSEGQSGLASAEFVINLQPASGQRVTFSVATAAGTAVSPSDFIATSAALAFAPGATDLFFPVLIRGDTTHEASELFSLNLSSVALATWPLCWPRAGSTRRVRPRITACWRAALPPPAREAAGCPLFH